MISNNEAHYQFSKQPSNPATDFNYTVLESESRIIVQQHTYEIKSLMRRTANDIIHIGQKLKEVKSQLGHGYFRRWLKIEFDWSIWTATKFMQVADKFKCVKFSHLDIAPSALYELAAPSTPDFVRFEAIERASHGETITFHAKHFGKTRLVTTRVVQLQKPSSFVQEQVKGDLLHFKHEHHFKAVDNGTILIDIIDFDGPRDIIGKVIGKLYLKSYLERFINKRNTLIQQYEESEKWRAVLS